MEITEISQQDIEQIQLAMTRQAASNHWKTDRQKRLNASRVDRICKITEKTNASVLARSFFNQKDLHTDAVNHGKTYEPVAVKKYEKKH